jgi:hypothetical protein
VLKSEECEEYDTDSQEDVDEFPDADFTYADEELRVLRLGECEVQGALPNTRHQSFHARLDNHLNKSTYKQVDAEEDQDFVGLPSTQGLGVGEDDG